jgi:oxygen-independent coproporphyrinogen-3 oxidase
MRGYALNKEEQLVREVITTLMCNERLNWKELSGHIGIPAEEIKRRLAYDESKLKEMAEDGIILYSPDEIKVNRGKNVFLRNVAAVFDPLMRNGKAKKFSKPV